MARRAARVLRLTRPRVKGRGVVRTSRGVSVMQTAEPTAFEATYRAMHGRVVRYAARRLANPADAEDVAAEVFRIAWQRHLGRDEVHPGWLFVTTDNVLRNHERALTRARRTAATAAGDRARGAAAPGTDEVLSDRVLEVLDGLDDATRRLLMLTYWDGLDGAELSQVLGVGRPAVWVRLHRARRAFAAAWGTEGRGGADDGR